jgi:hypothetical protein
MQLIPPPTPFQLIVLHTLFRDIFLGLERDYAKELRVIREQYPSDPPVITTEPLIIHWPDAIALMRQAGHQVFFPLALRRPLIVILPFCDSMSLSD